MKFQLGPVMVAVRDIDAAREFYRDIWNAKVGDIHDVPAGRMRRCFIDVGGGQLQLMQPHQGEAVLTRFLEDRGPGMYGQILLTDDIEDAASQLESKNLRTVGGMIEMDDMRELVVHPSETFGVLTVLRELR